MPPSHGGKGVPRDEAFACCISFRRAKPKTDGDCSSWSPSSDEFWKLPLPCPHHYFSPPSGERETNGQPVTCLERFGAHAHRGLLPGSELPPVGSEPSARAVSAKPCPLCLCPSASPQTLSSEQRNVYMERDCQGFKLHPLRNELSSYSLFVSFLKRLKCFLI